MYRIELLQALVEDLGVDALYLSSLPDVRWACGFTGSSGILIVHRDSADFLTDGRYKTQASEEVRGAAVHAAGYDLVGYVSRAGMLEGARRVAYQADHVTVASLAELEERLPDVDWHGEKELLARVVASKTSDEIDRIRAAQEITDDVFYALRDWIRPGLSEKDIAAEIVYGHLKRGAERMSFDPIVASGDNSARPHARPTNRRVERGDVILLDFGCFLDGYASDMTRIVALGDPDPLAREIYELVLSAQEHAIAGAGAGLASQFVDALARDILQDAGYGDKFTHGLGHGVGLQVHEWPRVSYSVDYNLPPDCVVSIEPGIYIPGRFGIRIEDLVVLREDGCENLTRASKAWTIL